MKRLTLLLLLVSVAFGQSTYTLGVPSSPVSPGSTVPVTVSIVTPGTTKPAALAFLFHYNAADVSSVGAVVSGTAAGANKIINCAQQAGGGYMCLITGINANTIADGLVVTLNVTIAPNTTHTTTQVSLTNDLGVTFVGDPISIADVPFVAIALVPSKCDVNSDGNVNSLDVNAAIDQALGRTTCGTADLNRDGACTVVEVQWIINMVVGGPAAVCRTQ